MSIADRKERAFQAREQLVIVEADDLLETHGYLGLNLDELADRVEYSKATLYHHFTSKEDLVLAVVNEHVRRRLDYFSRAALFRGETRERIFGIGIGDRILSLESPHGFPLMQLVKSDSIWAKCSETRRTKFETAVDKCFEIGVMVAEEAKARGDFSKWSPDPVQVIWGLVSISKGAHLLEGDFDFADVLPEGVNSMDFLFDSYHYYLDGLGWKPFSRDFDYAAARERIETQLFSEEINRLK